LLSPFVPLNLIETVPLVFAPFDVAVVMVTEYFEFEPFIKKKKK